MAESIEVMAEIAEIAVAFGKERVRLLMAVVPVAAPILTVVASPAMFSVVAEVLKMLAEAAVVVIFPPFTAMSPPVVIFPLLPVIEKFVAVMLLAPRDKALFISVSERSRALVIPPAADCILIPAVTARSKSKLSIRISWVGSVVPVPLARVKEEYPVEPSAVVIVNLESVAVSVRVKAMSLLSVVAMVLPPV